MDKTSLIIPPEDVLIFRAVKAHRDESFEPEADTVQSEVCEYAGKTWVHLYSKEKTLCGVYVYYPKSSQLRRR